MLTQRPNYTIAATTPHPLNASALAQSVAMPVSHGTFQPCAGTSVASVSSFIAGASQIIIIRPAAFVQRTGKTTSAGLRSVRLRGKRSRLWCRRLGSNQRRETARNRCVLCQLSYVCGWVPRHIPLWRRGGSLVLLWRWVTPFSRQPRRFSRCPIVGWTGRRASLPCYDTRTRTPTGGLEVSVGIGPTTCSLRVSCSAS